MATVPVDDRAVVGDRPPQTAFTRAWWAEGYRRFTVFCVVVTAAVALIDTATRAVLIGLLVVGPCMAVATRRAYPTALVGLWATGCSVALAAPDHIWGTHLELEYTVAVIVVAALSVAIAAVAEHRAGRRRTTMTGDDADVDFLVTAYGGVFDRAPDRQGLAHQLNALQNGESRERVLLGMVQSAEATTLALYRPGTRDLVADFWARGTEARRAARPICFLHTMKTGGTSLGHVLVGLVSPWPYLGELMLDQLVCLPEPLLNQAMLIAGHLPYEALDLLPSGMTLCTVVRHPVERTLSHHAHVNRILSGRGQEPVTIDEFLWTPRFQPMWRDYQARQLVHRIGLRDAWRSYSPVEEAAARGLEGADAEYPLQSLFDSTPLQLHGGALATAARERLETIEFVGTTDRLDGLVGRLAAFWERPAPRRAPRERVSTARLQARRLGRVELAAIEAGTTADATLYEEACRMVRTAA